MAVAGSLSRFEPSVLGTLALEAMATIDLSPGGEVSPRELAMSAEVCLALTRLLIWYRS